MADNLPTPESRVESYLAKAAGEDVTIPEKPLSRTEQYLAAIAEGGGGGGGTSDFDQLTNRPKYNGSPMTGETNIPESTTYTAGDGIDIVAGVIKATNTGKARLLTTADYNWPATGTKTAVALWLLPEGWYYRTSNSVVVMHCLGGDAFQNARQYNVFLVQPNYFFKAFSDTDASVPMIRGWNTTGAGALYNVQKYVMMDSDIADDLTSTSATKILSANQGKVLKDLVDSLAFKNAGAPTTATVGTVGQLLEDTTNGKLYICTAIVPGTDPDPDTYTWEEVGAGGGGITELTSADYNYPENSPLGVALWTLDTGFYSVSANIGVYYNTSDSRASAGVGTTFLVLKNNDSHRTWVVKQDSGNSPSFWVTHNLTGNKITADQALTPDIVQTTGTSTTDVMSQNAVTSMVYADPSTGKKVRLGNTVDMNTATDAIAVGAGVSGIGAYATAVGPYSSAGGANSVAIGQGANAGFKGSVAIGDNAITHYMGEVTIGTNYTGTGYNSSNYRLLTGLYDGQSAHDAATVGQAVGTTETYAIATSDWSALSASSPYDYQATITATYTIGANTIAELLNDSPVEFATHGFAIGSISSQSVTIYSIGAPSASVSLKVNYKG